MRLALIIEYEGTCYSGFQYQVNAPSVQGELEKAIKQFTNEDTRVRAAGRTDAGVHAKGQVVVFDTGSGHALSTFRRALNHYLPDDIAVKAAYKVLDGFDPRRHALRRAYRYTVLNSEAPSPLVRRTALHVDRPLDAARMGRAAGMFVGEHDFSRFAGPLEHEEASTVRLVYESAVRRSGDIVAYDVTGSAFLPHQVRRMAGALVDIGRGNLSEAELQDMIDGKATEAVAHALPPHGLCLVEVTYENFPPEDGEQDDDER